MNSKGKAPANAMETALRLLGVRQRSVFELTGRLKDKGFAPEEIDGAVERLLSAGYLNDAEFAKALARSRANVKSWGPLKITRDLAARGIEKQTAKEAVSLACRDEDSLASAALRKWRKRHKGLTGRQEKEKAFRHLSARGFAPSAIWKALGRPEDEDGA